MQEVRKVIILASRDKAPFYSLLGFQNVIVVDKNTVLQKILELKNRRDLAAILVEASIAREAGLDILGLNEKGLGPVVSMIPDDKHSISGDPKGYYIKFVSRIIGYVIGV
ncbi:V-type ATP synthase subunit F [Thermogladius sp. 4427co]|uniref:V-type ATP synthase subunit F n=1 Tax=Thermogladius sp. 4427co TaxID=3450718 RepID=UPI003F798CD2